VETPSTFWSGNKAYLHPIPLEMAVAVAASLLSAVPDCSSPPVAVVAPDTTIPMETMHKATESQPIRLKQGCSPEAEQPEAVEMGAQ
jgi:hypothetical protein